MTDLINRVDQWVADDINAVQELANKYSPVLQNILPEKNIPYIAVIIDICVTYLQGSHGASSADWKTWSVVLIKKLFEADVLESESEICPMIDEFLDYKADEYEKYCENRIAASEYDMDRGFFYTFVDKKIGSH